MIPYNDALKIVKREIEKTETVITEISLEESSGYFLAEDVYTDTFLPPFDNSSMDGFAVKYNPDIKCWRIIGEISAGNFEQISVDENSAVRIMTGGKIAVNADAVIPLEDVIENDGLIELRNNCSVKFGQCIRKKGEDITPGILVLPKSTLLKPQNISIAAACGKKTLKVYSRIKIGVLATGDELVDIAEKPEGDKIRGTNLYTLISLITESGMTAVNLGLAKDDRDLIEQKISDALKSDIDIIITTGGVSVGKYDYLKDIFEHIGAEIYFTKVNIKPGKPVIFGRYGSKLIFGLPGNPVSSFVSFIIFIKQALGKNNLHQFTAELKKPLKKQDSKRHFVRGSLVYNDIKKRYYVQECGSQSSGNMAGLNNADCLIIFPEEKIEMLSGEIVECILI